MGINDVDKAHIAKLLAAKEGKKLYVKHDSGTGTFNGNTNERIVPIKLGNSDKPRLRFKSNKGNMEG